jgi:hypothetical protein
MLKVATESQERSAITSNVGQSGPWILDLQPFPARRDTGRAEYQNKKNSVTTHLTFTLDFP